MEGVVVSAAGVAHSEGAVGSATGAAQSADATDAPRLPLDEVLIVTQSNIVHWE